MHLHTLANPGSKNKDETQASECESGRYVSTYSEKNRLAKP